MLHDDFQTWDDIKKYFQEGYADICRKSPSMVHVEIPWPRRDVLKAQGYHFFCIIHAKALYTT